MENKEVKNTEEIKEQKSDELAKNEEFKLQNREHHINQLNKEAKSNLFARSVMAIIILAVTIPCVFFGLWTWIAYIVLLATIITLEICRAPQSIENKFKTSVYVFAFIMMFTLVFYIFVKDIVEKYIHFNIANGTGEGFTYDLAKSFASPQLSMTTVCLCFLLIFLQVFYDKEFKIFDAFYFIVMLFVCSLGLQCLIYLRFLPYSTYESTADMSTIFKYLESTALLFYVLAGTTLNDVGAYIFGVLFGKRKMCPNISPKKTWAGFVGGIITSFIVSFGFGMLLSYFNVPLLEGVLDFKHWYNILILSIVMPFAGTFGDLLFSSIKRGYHIKDFGTILKSHGGILDRFDSIIISSIVVSLIIIAMKDGAAFIA